MSKINYQALREAAEAIKIAATPQKLLAFRMKVTPQVVLALLDERESKDKAWSEQDNHINQQADRIESLEKKNGETGRALEAAEKRIAELEANLVALAAENAGLKSDVPLGAIENGKAFADRLENYQFECEGGNLNMCSDWQEFRRCLEYLSEWAMHSQTEHPATDAFLSDVRAGAFNDLCAAFVRHAKIAGLDDADTVTLKEVTEALLHCAEQIRAPE